MTLRARLSLTFVAAAALLALHAPALLPWAAPVLLGLILAAPFASLTMASSRSRSSSVAAPPTRSRRSRTSVLRPPRAR